MIEIGREKIKQKLVYTAEAPALMLVKSNTLALRVKKLHVW